MLLLSYSCDKKSYLSPDINNKDLLPDMSDYLSEDYGTQEIAKFLEGVYPSSIGLIVYDDSTRTKPIMYLTRGEADVVFKALESGAVEISYTDFQTIIMPLKMSVKIKAIPEERNDTIFLRGTDGMVRTKIGNEDLPIGTPLPESDDAELVGSFARKDNKPKLFIDLMLPVAVKALIRCEEKK